MSNLLVSFLAYFLDRIFGEFSFIKHPVIIIGELITWLEKHIYNDTIIRGGVLTLFTLIPVLFISSVLSHILNYLPLYLTIFLTSILASMFLAHRMLYDAVFELTQAHDPNEKLSMLVSRDTKELSESEVYKAGIETYAENLSDGVIAPLFYLLLFGLPGIMTYKAVNTLDSMVGYRNERYEKFGKASAILDDIANFIPSRLTALLIMLLSNPARLLSFYPDGRKHLSPNAGHPITAIALAIGAKLGGPTSYFGQLQDKAYFGKGKTLIEKEDILKALSLRTKIDIFLFLSLLIGVAYAL